MQELPSRIRQRQEDLTSLSNVVARMERLQIMQPDQLMTPLQNVRRTLQDLLTKLQTFTDECQIPFFAWLWKSRRLSRIEEDITKMFAALEADKTTLILSTLVEIHKLVSSSTSYTEELEGEMAGM